MTDDQKKRVSTLGQEYPLIRHKIDWFEIPIKHTLKFVCESIKDAVYISHAGYNYIEFISYLTEDNENLFLKKNEPVTLQISMNNIGYDLARRIYFKGWEDKKVYCEVERLSKGRSLIHKTELLEEEN